MDTIGVYRGSTGAFLLRNSNSAGAADFGFSLGGPGDIAIAGDWNGDGRDTTGVFRPSNTTFYLTNSNDQGWADVAFGYGFSSDKPIAGDWNSDGIDTIGLFRPSEAKFYLRNANSTGNADLAFGFGATTDVPLAGNWDGQPMMLPPTPPPTATPNPNSPMNASFAYDGDGKRVKSVMTANSVTTTSYFVGAHYEITNPGANQTITKYYYAGAQRIAMRTNGTLKFILGDHLGSTSLVTDAAGNNAIETRYKAWGEVRYTSGSMLTEYQYTGQFNYESQFGLYFYNARWYDSSLGRFAQADTIIPDGVHGLDRYAYVNNNPLRFTDPSGHKKCAEVSETGKCIDHDLDFTGYSVWERKILLKLYNEGGPLAIHGVDYILANDIHITVGESFIIYAPNPNGDVYSGDWQSMFNVAGWYEEDDFIVLDPQHNEVGKMPNDWNLSVIIHEALHIEQGEDVAKSKAGEMQAGQVGLDVYLSLTGKKRRDLTGWQVDVYDATTVADYHAAFEGQSYWWNLVILPNYPGWHRSPVYP